VNELDTQILDHRTSFVRLQISHGGKPLVGKEIRVAQKTHGFQFGANWCGEFIALANGQLTGKQAQEAERFAEQVFELFNQATLPFYWAQFEPEQGKPRTEQLMNLAKWYKSHGIAVKAHPLCWHTLAPDWLLSMDPEEILHIQIQRINRDVTEFAGIIDTWDVVNEPVIMPIFDRYDNGITQICKKLGRIELIKTMVDAARNANPRGTFLINDFETSPAYDILIEGCLAAGIRFDALGIQSHMHQGYWGPKKTNRILKRFERFGLPIHFTENTIVSGAIMPAEIVDLNDYQVTDWPSTPQGEERQLQEVMTHIKTLLAHPLVQSFTWWDVKDGAWLNAPSGFFRKDGSVKPVYQEVKNLFKKELWHSPKSYQTNQQGELEFKGPLGEYELTIDDRSFTVDLAKGDNPIISIDI
jgi:endo-1,4-beta-xylanase